MDSHPHLHLRPIARTPPSPRPQELPDARDRRLLHPRALRHQRPQPLVTAPARTRERESERASRERERQGETRRGKAGERRTTQTFLSLPTVMPRTRPPATSAPPSLPAAPAHPARPNRPRQRERAREREKERKRERKRERASAASLKHRGASAVLYSRRREGWAACPDRAVCVRRSGASASSLERERERKRGREGGSERERGIDR